MYNPITKIARYLRREYPERTITTAAAGGLGFGVSTAGFLAAAAGTASILMIPAFGFGLAALALLASFMPMPFDDRPTGNTDTINGVKLVGSRRDIASIYMTQQLISGITRNKQHLPELPAHTAKRVARHINDIKERFTRVRAYTSGDKPATDFSFTREFIDTAGKTVTQAIATLETPMTAREARAALLPQVLASPGPLALPSPTPTLGPAAVPAISPEFGSLAKKVDEVEKRVGQLENPPLAILDKPRLG